MQIKLRTALLEKLKNLTPKHAEVIATTLEYGVDDWNEPERTIYVEAIKLLKEVE